MTMQWMMTLKNHSSSRAALWSCHRPVFHPNPRKGVYFHVEIYVDGTRTFSTQILRRIRMHHASAHTAIPQTSSTMAPPPPSFAHTGRKRKQVSHYSDDNPSTFTTKHKRGEEPVEPPPKHKSLPKLDKTTPSRRKRPMETTTKQKEQETSANDDSIIVHDHAMRLYPILPSSLVAHSNETGNDVIFGAGLGPPRPLFKPEWQLINTPHMNAISEFVKRKKTLPPRIICMHTFGNYLVFGDSLGQVLVYTLHPLVLHVATISTTASARDKPKPSLKRLSEQNAILCICMQGEYIMIATSSEIEAYHAVDQSRVWSYSLEEERVHVTKLDVHATTHNVLVSVSSTEDVPISPLWLLTHDSSSGEVSVTRDILPLSVLRCAGMWDRSECRPVCRCNDTSK